MRRAVSVAAVVVIGLVLFVVGPHAATMDQAKLMNGIGLVDYSRRPHWQVGSWVQYKMEGESEKGHRDDYLTTLVIAGEECFWGDTCFWLETWTQHSGRPRRAIACLISYSIFDDSLAWARPQLYVRKFISGIDDDGNIHTELYVRSGESFKVRDPLGSDKKRNLDTLGVEEASVPAGTFKTMKVRRKFWEGGSIVKGDSTIYDEMHQDSDSYLSKDVPITSLVKQAFETTGSRKAWLVGQSQDAPLRLVDRGEGLASLVAFGRDTTGIVIPEQFRKPLARQAVRTAETAKKRG